MAEDDRRHWDERYAVEGPPSSTAAGPPDVFAPYADVFPSAGRALEIACGQGQAAVWLAQRGLTVWGVDVSSVAVDRARDLARRTGVADRCRFEAVDLDGGLPAGPAVDVLMCHRFRDRRLDGAIRERLAPGGLLAMAVLSEVGAAPGRFRAAPGELRAAFGDLDVLHSGEGQGLAWLLARR
ncbi:class I SAM-dependent methyltransferase [Mycobacterium sp. Marseille-P9652]|uniref:class I SAM-dependent methyltransferase n=1 Tax=Mycobacterium sp. Marseille-P9652 TaxID=2654950 RepID=UPI0012E909FC|nr:class I SAM-dependent methyltransferase [Mycobacterium sp. Marseille-P9652]